MKFIRILILQFYLAICFFSAFSQEMIKLQVLCKETNTPVEVSVILINPSGKIYLTNEDGYVSVNKNEFEAADSFQISHISFTGGSFKKEEIESSGNGNYLIRLEPVNYVFPELVIKPVNTRKLVEGFTRLFDLRKVMSYTNARGFFSNHIMQGDSLLGFFISDVLIFHGGNDSVVYTKDFFELSRTTMSAVHLNSVTTEKYATQPCVTDPLYRKRSLKYENIAWIETYLFRLGPLNQKFRKFYNYSIDSVYSMDGLKMFKVAFNTKKPAKSRTRALTGSGFIWVDENNVVHSVEIFDAFFPLKYEQKLQMYRFEQYGYKNHYIIHYKPTHKGLFPVFIQYSGFFENGYKEFATINLYQMENIVNFTNNNYYSLTLGLRSFENAPFLFYDLENWRKRWDLYELYGAKGFHLENPANYQEEMERMQGLIFNECEDLISFPGRYTKVKQIYEEYIINRIIKTINKTGL